jgi:hypothetical protein
LTVNGAINATGDVTAYSSSDIRLKENIRKIDNALDKIRTLQGVLYDWNDEFMSFTGNSAVPRQDTGVIAQEVLAVLPEVVFTRPNGYLAVRYEKLTGLIIQAINDLADQVDELKKSK